MIMFARALVELILCATARWYLTMTEDSHPDGIPIGYPNFHVRPVGLGDAERLSRFYCSLSDQSRYFFEPYRDRSVEGMRAVVERAVAGTDLALVAVDPEDEVIAHFFYMDVAKEVPHMGIGLRDAYHGRGLGAVLLAYLIAVGTHILQKKTVGLTVMKKNRRAFHLYKKHGFRVVRKDITFRTEHDSYEMWRSNE